MYRTQSNYLFQNACHLYVLHTWIGPSYQYVFIAGSLHSTVYKCTVFAGAVGKVLHQMLVIQAFRADRLLAMAGRFVATVMGETFRHSAEQELDLAAIVNKEVRGREMKMAQLVKHALVLRIKWT